MACPKTRKSGTGKNLARIGNLTSAKKSFFCAHPFRGCLRKFPQHLAFDSRCGLSNSPGVSELPWFVAHTRPRREKKLVEFCERHGFATTLPCYNSAHKYRGKTVVFRKPLFPGYVFLRLDLVQHPVPGGRRALAVEHGANVFINSSAWPFPRLEHLRILALARAIENQCYLILANRVGTDDGVTFCGTSAIIDPYGVIVAAASADREELIQAEISEEVIKSVRSRMAVFNHRRQDLY